MREITFTRQQFDKALYPAIAQQTAEGGSDWDCALNIMRALKDPELTEEIPLTPLEQRSEDEGKPVFRFRRLLDDEATFTVEEAEYAFLKKKLKAHRKQVMLGMALDFEDVLQIIEAAEKIEPEKKPKKVEPAAA